MMEMVVRGSLGARNSFYHRPEGIKTLHLTLHLLQDIKLSQIPRLYYLTPNLPDFKPPDIHPDSFNHSMFPPLSTAINPHRQPSQPHRTFEISTINIASQSSFSDLYPHQSVVVYM
ncbi:hypothetical protein BDR22DRAFT_867281 [Usnea florida]